MAGVQNTLSFNRTATKLVAQAHTQQTVSATHVADVPGMTPIHSDAVNATISRGVDQLVTSLASHATLHAAHHTEEGAETPEKGTVAEHEAKHAEERAETFEKGTAATFNQLEQMAKFSEKTVALVKNTAFEEAPEGAAGETKLPESHAAAHTQHVTAAHHASSTGHAEHVSHTEHVAHTEHGGAAERMEHAENVVEHIGVSIGLATAGVELVAAGLNMVSDAKNIGVLGQSRAEVKEKQSPLEAFNKTFGSKEFQVEGKKISGAELLKTLLHESTTVSTQVKLFQALSSANVPESTIQTLKTAVHAQRDLHAIETKMQDTGTRAVLSPLKALSSAAASVVKAVKVFGSVAGHALGAAAAGIGAAVSSVKILFDARALTRAVKSFTRSQTDNVHLKSLQASKGVDQTKLDNLQKNINRIAKKKVVDKTLSTVSSAVGIAVGVVALALAVTNPIGAAIGLVALGVGVGIAIYSRFRDNRHAGKVQQNATQINQTQKFAKAQLDKMEAELEVPGAKKADILKKYGFRTEADFQKAKESITSESFTLSFSHTYEDRGGMSGVHRLADMAKKDLEKQLLLSTKSDVDKLKSSGDHNLVQVAKHFETLKKELDADFPAVTKRLGIVVEPSKNGVTDMDKIMDEVHTKLFDHAKQQVLEEISANHPKTMDDFSARILDQQTRDEGLIDDMFKQLYSTASPEDKKLLVSYYSDISVSQGKEGVNEAMLADHHGTGHVSKFSEFKRFADLKSE